jgi:hypothetical protein
LTRLSNVVTVICAKQVIWGVMTTEDAIGFVRPHKRISESAQTSSLNQDGCKGIVHDRADLEKLARKGTTIKVRHIFLLADPRSRGKKGGWRKDLLSFMARMEKAGVAIKDVSNQLTTAIPQQRYDMVELAMRQLSSNGRTIHLEGKRSGRKPLVFSEPELNKAEKIWLNVKAYPTEKEAAEALKGVNKKFSTARARRKWGSRKYTQES